MKARPPSHWTSDKQAILDLVPPFADNPAYVERSPPQGTSKTIRTSDRVDGEWRFAFPGALLSPDFSPRHDDADFFLHHLPSRYPISSSPVRLRRSGRSQPAPIRGAGKDPAFVMMPK